MKVLVLVAVCLFSFPVRGQAPSSAVLPESLLLVFGQAAETRYVPRVRAIHELPANLTAEQANACYEFLNRKLASQPLPDLEFNGLKNELVFALMRQRRRPEELAARLVAMYREQSHDETWRDYCVQFFGKWYADAPRNAGREAMAAALWEVLRTERANRFAGAAATQLGFLAGKYPEFPCDEVAAACLEALLDPVCSETAKVALLQVCATLDAVGALPEARRLAAAKTNPVLRASAYPSSLRSSGRRFAAIRLSLLRKSAIAAVGFLGDRSDLAWLTPLVTSSIPFVAALLGPPLRGYQTIPFGVASGLRHASPNPRPGRHQPTAGEAMKNTLFLPRTSAYPSALPRVCDMRLRIPARAAISRLQEKL